MKVLIAYDGSDCSDAALDDLPRAGLPGHVDARVFSVVGMAVTDALYPVQALSTPMASYPLRQPDALPAPAKLIEQMRNIAGSAADRLRRQFPAWTIDMETGYGVPGPLIVDQTKTWKADLVLMGSHGRHGVSRLMTGSVSQHVLNHSCCAVRITHRTAGRSSDPIRLLVALDTSLDAARALRAIISRAWPAGTEARAIGVVDADAADSAATPDRVEQLRGRVANVLRDAAGDLRRGGLVASHQVLTGEPSLVIIQESADWDADCIFLGARGIGAIQRLMLGSVSSQVAAHAHCSVEVIRHSP